MTAPGVEEDAERLFEGFVCSVVALLEQRDPTTFGHMGRVAGMAVSLAQAADQVTHGPLRDVHFSRDQIREIRYAALLHDIGMVAVREQLLFKTRKLYLPDLALIRQRVAFIRRTMEAEYRRQQVEYLKKEGMAGYDPFLQKLAAEHQEHIEELDRFMHLVLDSNEPTALPDGSLEGLQSYTERYYEDLDGRQQPYLTDDEVRCLSIRQGCLDESERLEMEMHVAHTYGFLHQIPWRKELAGIPLIAYGHHEKLDGSGYPRKLRGPDIPVQTRIITIADIFDALTASDRPYKRAVPIPLALDIMAEEVKAGMLDADLFKLFVESKAFEVT